MHRTFLLQLFFLVFINLLIKPFYAFGIDLQVQNRLGEAYGFYFVLLNFSFLFQIFSDWGLQQYNNRQVAQYEGWIPRFLPQLLLWKLLLSVVMLAIGSLAAALLGYWQQAGWAVAGVLLNQVLITFVLFMRSNVSGLQYYFLDSILSVSDKLWMILFCLIGLYTDWLGVFTIYTFIYAQTAALLITALLSIFFLYRCIQTPIRWSLSLHPQLLRRVTPYAVVVLLTYIYVRTDALLIDKLLPAPLAAQEASLYAFGYRLLDMASIFCFLFANLLLPMFTRLLRQPDALHQLLELSFRWMVALTVTASSLLFFYAHPIAQWLYDAYTPHTAHTLQVLMLSFNAIGVIYIFGTLLTAGGRLWLMNAVFVVAIVVNIGTNCLLIPSYGALGAAYAGLLTQTMVGLAEIYLVWRWVPRLFAPTLWLRMLFFIAGTVALAYGSTLIPSLDWRWAFLLAGAAIGVLALATRWLDLGGLRHTIAARRSAS